jgi:hypothetical protein
VIGKIIFFIVLTTIFFVIGVIAGGALFLMLTGDALANLKWNTVFMAWNLPLSDVRFAYAPWATCVVAGTTFLPGIIFLMVLFRGRFKKASLHGDARFANNSELRPYLYRGDYSK